MRGALILHQRLSDPAGRPDTFDGYYLFFDLAIVYAAFLLGFLILAVIAFVALVGMPFLFKKIVIPRRLPMRRRRLFLRSDWDVMDSGWAEQILIKIIIGLFLMILSVISLFLYAQPLADTLQLKVSSHTSSDILEYIMFDIAMGICLSVASSVVYLVVGIIRTIRRLRSESDKTL
ncbi:hypothetical protein B0H34DRAFT_715743 [Crassisporium funariophilum]|nr:hypothetical protein B0H34DRAFT_715743 [Crassisporium funariophilum]